MPFSKSVIFAVAALSAISSATSDNAFAKRDIIQGWALVQDVCPSGTGTCGARSCCPVGSYCDTTSSPNSNFCCSTSDACGASVVKNSQCALPNWVLYNTVKDPICCLAGETAIQPTTDETYGHCLIAGSSVPTGAVVIPVGAAASSIGSSTSSAATGSVTSAANGSGTKTASTIYVNSGGATATGATTTTTVQSNADRGYALSGASAAGIGGIAGFLLLGL